MTIPTTWPALVATARGALWRAADGPIERLPAADAARRATASLPLVCHAPAVAARLGLDDLVARDLLELYAFVRPATFCLPTPRGLCEALDLPVPTTSGGRGHLPGPRRPRPARRARGHGGARFTRIHRHRARHGARPMGVGRRGDRGPRHRPAGRPQGAAGRRARYLEDPAAMGGTAAATAAFEPAGRAARGAPAAGADDRRRLEHGRSAADPERLCLGGEPGLRAARARGPAQCRAGRGRHRRRQDPGLCRAGQPVGGEERRAGLDRHLHPQPAAPDRQRARPPAPRFRREASPRGDPQGPRETISAC